MATKKITTAVVDDLKAGEVVFDTEVRGFFVRHRGGDARYGLKTRIRGRQVILTIGRHGRGDYGPERARREAERLRGLIRDGKDPAAERAAEKGAPTLEGFAARYMAEYAELQKSPGRGRRMRGFCACISCRRWARGGCGTWSGRRWPGSMLGCARRPWRRTARWRC